MTAEQRLDQMEKRNKRLTVAATGDKVGEFDTVVVRQVKYLKQ